MVGSRVGELIAEAQLIYNWEAEADDVASLIHPHPTQSEALGEAHLASPASLCTCTADRPAPSPALSQKEHCPDADVRHHARPGRERHRGHGHPLAQAGG